jgi:hypothetical protein
MPSLASADYEQVPEHFGRGGESEQLARAYGIAVNASGAGGVEAGSLYVVGQTARVLRFSPGGEGEAPQFREAWGWGVGSESQEYQRCGPAFASEPRPEGTFPTCLPSHLTETGGEEPGHFAPLGGVAVDPATGNVYVLNQPGVGGHPPALRDRNLVEVFSPTGAPIGEGFGDLGRERPFPSESISEGPEKLHEQSPNSEEGIAVDEAGVVYVLDRDFGFIEGTQQTRVMSFEPDQPGNYEHYSYAAGRDIASNGDYFIRIALAGPDRLVVTAKELISEYSTDGSSVPICNAKSSGGQVEAMTANPNTGEVFYLTAGSKALHRMGSCNESSKKFEELQGPVVALPEEPELLALAVDPVRKWTAQRPMGVVYGVAGSFTGNEGIGDVFAPAQIKGPEITSESVANTTGNSVTLQAQIDPRGSTSSFRFQYLPEAHYQANDPNERQSLAVGATQGTFGLGFDGRSLGGIATANLNSGSTTASSLITAKGTATLLAANGTATLHGAVGNGTVIEGLNKIVGVSATEGTFAIGQTVVGKGIPVGTTVTATSGSELTISAKATESQVGIDLSAGTATLNAVKAAEGVFAVGMQIEGVGIPSGTKVTAVIGTSLTLSQPVTRPGTAVAIHAGSTSLEGLSVFDGVFEPGQPISGPGIPAGATITAVESGVLQISGVPTKPGAGVAISSSGPAPLAVGEVVEGPGIPEGTVISAAKAGELTLSRAATTSSVEAHIRAGLPFDASANAVGGALEGLATIGEGNVEVSGGPGDESGSHPYLVTFTGALGNQDLPELSTEDAGLTGGSASAAVTAVHNGGGGFAQGAAETPVPAARLAVGGLATAPASELDSDTTYRFRVVAECSGPGEPPCEVFGAPASFRTQSVSADGLPDSRVYELVSPVQKHGGEVFPADPRVSSCLLECKPPGLTDIFATFPMQSVPGGDAVSYMGFPFSPTEGSATFNSYVSRRTASGWQTTPTSPRLLTSHAGVAYDDSLGAGLVAQSTSPQLTEDAPAAYPNLYLQNTEDPNALRPLLTNALFASLRTQSGGARPYREPGSLTLAYAGHSQDFSAQYFEANDSLTFATPYAPEPPGLTGANRDLYEWREGDISILNVLPGNTTVATGAAFASASPDTHAVSSDGQRVFWSAGSHLYMREGNRTTREIHDPGAFIIASPDGLQVLLSDGCLYSLSNTNCIDLAQGHGGFLGTVGSSEDLSRIYFVDTAALPGANERGQEAVSGSPNLYLYEEGGATRFIATLASSDGAVGGGAGLNDWAATPALRSAEASPNGTYLAFGSTVELTGHHSVGLCRKSGTETEFIDATCNEVFLYDSSTERLTCPSCNPTGEAPLGNSTLRRIIYGAGNGGLTNGWLPQPRYLTNQGRLFFDSSDRLSPRDTNGRIEDVYEAEPPSVGSCERAGGCVSLISSGTGSVDSDFLAMDESGSNVFFTSRERLVPADADDLIDLYDARVGGGFPSEDEGATPECHGEACQSATNAPTVLNSGTSGLQGTGNVRASKAQLCPKGKVKHKGKCIKKPKKQKGHKKRSRKNSRRPNTRKHGGAK